MCPCRSLVLRNICLGFYGNDIALLDIHQNQQQQPQRGGVCVAAVQDYCVLSTYVAQKVFVKIAFHVNAISGVHTY